MRGPPRRAGAGAPGSTAVTCAGRRAVRAACTARSRPGTRWQTEVTAGADLRGDGCLVLLPVRGRSLPSVDPETEQFVNVSRPTATVERTIKPRTRSTRSGKRR